MGTQTVEFRGPPGRSLTVRLFLPGSDAIVQTASSCTEQTNRKGCYRAVFTDPGATEFELIATDGVIPAASGYCTLTLATALFTAYSRSVRAVQNDVGGNVAGSVNSVTSDVNASATSVRSAVGMAAANLDTQLSGIQSDTTTLTGRLTASRALYLDNLNVGGPVASQADINALNQSASRRLILTTLQQLERPETGSTSYQIEARTFDADGAAVNADSTPTLTATGTLSGSLNANLSAATNPATGVYRWTYSVANNATQEQIRFDLSATIATAAFSISAFAAVVDLVSATWTSTDASRLAAIYNKLPSRAYLTGATAATGELVPGDILNQLPSGGWTSGSFGDRLLISANNNRTAFLTGSQHIAADVHAFQPAVIDSAALAASAISAIQSGLATATAQATAQTDLDDIQTRLPASLVGGLMASISQQLGTTAENQVNAQVLDVLAVDLFTELNAVPAATASLKDKITFLFMLARNKVTQDTTTFRLFADDTTTQVASAAVTDSAGVTTRGELT